MRRFQIFPNNLRRRRRRMNRRLWLMTKELLLSNLEQKIWKRNWKLIWLRRN